MFPMIEMEATLLRSSEDILNSLIMLCLGSIIFMYCLYFVGIEVSYTECKDLQASLKSQNNG